MSIADLTQDAVLAAVREFDALGRNAFLKKYSYGEAQSYFLLHNGRRYDSKAIAGAAHGFLPGHAALLPANLSAGDKAVNARLTELGFIVTVTVSTFTMTPQAVLQQDGTPLDATFNVEVVDGVLTVVMESRGGTRGTPNARNTDYIAGLELLLERLRELRATLTDASVASSEVRDLPADARRLVVQGMSYPIIIDDSVDLQRRLGAAQARVGRHPNAKGGGNRTKRIRLVLGFRGSPPSAEMLRSHLSGAPQRPAPDAHVRRPYVRVGTIPASVPRDPFAVDPDKVDRGNQAHAATQDALADYLRAGGVMPVSPTGCDPEFDLAWNVGGIFYVAEVKSLTTANEEKQLRLGLGQVLRYRQQLKGRELQVVAVLVAERKPVEPSWAVLCGELSILLVWPETFGTLPSG